MEGINVESLYVVTPEGVMTLLDYLQHNTAAGTLEARVTALEERLDADA